MQYWEDSPSSIEYITMTNPGITKVAAELIPNVAFHNVVIQPSHLTLKRVKYFYISFYPLALLYLTGE